MWRRFPIRCAYNFCNSDIKFFNCLDFFLKWFLCRLFVVGVFVVHLSLCVIFDRKKESIIVTRRMLMLFMAHVCILKAQKCVRTLNELAIEFVGGNFRVMSSLAILLTLVHSTAHISIRSEQQNSTNFVYIQIVFVFTTTTKNLNHHWNRDRDRRMHAFSGILSFSIHFTHLWINNWNI